MARLTSRYALVNARLRSLDIAECTLSICLAQRITSIGGHRVSKINHPSLRLARAALVLSRFL